MSLADAAIEVQVGRIAERVESLEGRLDRHEELQNDSLDKIGEELKDIRKDFKSLRDDLAGRPTWFVTTIITLLGSAVVGLLVQLAKGGGM